jgi:hypothetical protein
MLDTGYWMYGSGLYLYPLAQTWHARTEFYSSCILDIKAAIAYYNYIAPPDPVPVSGRGGRAVSGI